MGDSVGALGENVRVAARVLAHGARLGGRRLGAGARLRPPGRSPDKLLIAPQDLRTADPTVAGEIYAGRFTFAGKSVSTGGLSPFIAEPPSRDWAAELAGFGWLRHLRAADTTLARANARALVDEWMTMRGKAGPAARAPEVAARRLIAWLSHSPLILDGADKVYYRRFLKSLARQSGRLARAAAGAPDGAPRLSAAIALCFAGLCLSGETRLLRQASRMICDEIDRQILADGGHASRDPTVLVELLLDMIPLKQTFLARNLEPPQGLVSAIDRMTPMLRFFRHGDGEFAHFNGAGSTSADLVATVLAYDDARGQPLDDAVHSGYQRLAAGESLVIMDAGPPPPLPMSSRAHAGCLSFEFSSGPERIVVNCGAPRFGREDWERAARATPAHSTVTIGDESSCRFTPGGLRRFVGQRVVAGPKETPARRRTDENGVTVVASHDGYAARFGVIHERALMLESDGGRLSGEDSLHRPGDASPGGGAEAKLALRFHLHPSVRASARQDGQGVVLVLPSGAGWSFSAPGFPVTLEESVYLASVLGPRRCEQIVVHGAVRASPRIAWTFDRLPVDAQPKRRMPVAEAFDPLPL